MSIQSFFEPVADFLWQKKYPENSFFKQIHWYGEEFPDLKGIQTNSTHLAKGNPWRKGK